MSDVHEPDRVIEYFYALASPWSYLGNAALGELARRHDLVVEPFIIDYDRMFRVAGTIPLPERPKLRKAYRLVELRRWSAFRDVPLNPEPRFYQGEVEEPDEHSAALLVTAAKLAGADSWRLGHALSRALWAEERFPFNEDEMRRIATDEGFDYDALTTPHMIGQARTAYTAATEHAIARYVFGMPFYIFRDEPFWGQDRIELLQQAVERAEAA